MITIFSIHCFVLLGGCSLMIIQNIPGLLCNCHLFFTEFPITFPTNGQTFDNVNTANVMTFNIYSSETLKPRPHAFA